jgi:hypothetical protein
MTPRVTGTEMEVACAIPDRDRTSPTAPVAAMELMKLARQLLTWLPDAGGGGIFLSNGGRLYLDTGHHPEY